MSQPGATVDGVRVASWIASRLRWARRAGWQGRVISGIRSHRLQHQLWEEWQAGKRAGPVARPGTSNHEGTRYPRGAVDVTEGEALERIMAFWPGPRPLVPFGRGDRPHFSATGR